MTGWQKAWAFFDGAGFGCMAVAALVDLGAGRAGHALIDVIAMACFAISALAV